MKDERVREDRVLVYSTDGTLPLPAPGRGAPRKTQPTQRAMPNDGVVRVAREKRRNSAVTVVHGLAGAEVDTLGKELKRLCGTGGTAKNGVIELQGDHRDKIVAYFQERNRPIKRAGG